MGLKLRDYFDRYKIRPFSTPLFRAKPNFLGLADGIFTPRQLNLRGVIGISNHVSNPMAIINIPEIEYVASTNLGTIGDIPTVWNDHILCGFTGGKPIHFGLVGPD